MDDIVFDEIDSIVDFTNVDFFMTVLGNDNGGNGIAVLDPWHPLISFGTFSHDEATQTTENGKLVEKMAFVHVGENGGGGPVDGMEVASSIVIEEIGHALGFGDGYWVVQPLPGGAARSHTTGYSPMSRWLTAGQSSMHTHFLSWEQVALGWIGTAGLVDSLPRSSNPELRTLSPLSNQSPGAGQRSVVALPHEGSLSSGFRGYTLEARIRDMTNLTTDSVFQSGVVVTWVDSTLPTKSRRLTVQQDPNQPVANGLEFALEVGDVFQDLARGVQVTVTGQGSGTYDVQVLFDEPGMKPDLTIRKWQPPDWETPDIWINNLANDSGGRVYAFPDGNRDALLAREDPMDPPIPHEVHYKFRNASVVSAHNVSVNAYWANAGMEQVTWNLIGTNVYSLVPGSPSAQAPVEVEGFIEWEPPASIGSDDHICVKIEIVPAVSSLDLDPVNNVAQENIMNIETVRNSPWHSVSSSVMVGNPGTMTATISMVPDGFPDEWWLDIHPKHFVLEPSQTRQVQFTIYPSGDPSNPIPGADPGTLIKTRLVAVGHINGEAELYGGVGMWVHHRLASTLTAAVSDHSSLGATVTGKLSTSSGAPSLSGRTIGLQVVSPSKSSWVYATTDSGGNYSAVFETPEAGSYEVRAIFVGGGTIASIRSASVNHSRP